MIRHITHVGFTGSLPIGRVFRGPDPKPPKRRKDKKLMRELHEKYGFTPCWSCGVRPGAMLHHVKRRSQGGDDSEENLQWLCAWCHAEVHS